MHYIHEDIVFCDQEVSKSSLSFSQGLAALSRLVCSVLNFDESQIYMDWHTSNDVHADSNHPEAGTDLPRSRQAKDRALDGLISQFARNPRSIGPLIRKTYWGTGQRLKTPGFDRIICALIWYLGMESTIKLQIHDWEGLLEAVMDICLDNGFYAFGEYSGMEDIQVCI